MGIEAKIFRGRVFHKRFSPKVYELKHSVYFISFPLSRIEELITPIFSVDRFNLLSFHTRDHGDREGGNLWDWAKGKLIDYGITQEITEIEIQTFPRVLGMVFNPVSFWFCYHLEKWIATIVEVNNTFGESFSYVLTDETSQADKKLHVSPFYKIEGHYEFQFKIHGTSRETTIKYFKEKELQLLATLSATARPWTTPHLLKAWMRSPFLTYFVLFAIHFHALVLYLKKIPFYGVKGT